MKERKQALVLASYGVGVQSALRVGVSRGIEEAVGKERGGAGRQMPQFPLPSPG